MVDSHDKDRGDQPLSKLVLPPVPLPKQEEEDGTNHPGDDKCFESSTDQTQKNQSHGKTHSNKATLKYANGKISLTITANQNR